METPLLITILIFSILNLIVEIKDKFKKKNKIMAIREERAKKVYNEEELLAFGKSCFYKGFEKAEKDDANCYTAFREEIGNLVEQLKNK